jgi:eukaryotic-like serine/threonine-protein kinase
VLRPQEPAFPTFGSPASGTLPSDAPSERTLSSDAPLSSVAGPRSLALSSGALSSTTPSSAFASTPFGASPVSSGQRSRVRLGSVPVNSQQELRFVQERLALSGQIIFCISTMFLVMTSAIDQWRGTMRMTLNGRAFHLAATLLALGLWRLCRTRRALSARTLANLDRGATLCICACYAAMGHFVPQPWGTYTSLLAIGHVTIGRAVIVPSTPWRTLWLALGNFAGISVSGAWLAASPALHASLGTSLHGLADAVLWSFAGTALASVTSKVIYGLHETASLARQLGQYTLEQKIGSGSMGEIFRARHAMLRRPTAIKLMSDGGSEQALRRFEKEVQLTARLTHPNTICIYDYGRTPEGRFYYAMELLDGMTLEQLVLQAGPQPAARVIHILLQICGALREAHGVGLIHRDIKPANVYLCSRGGSFDVVKVLDFGLVREFKNPTNVTLSSVDAIAGTPLYLSPEAIVTPAQVDGRADIYALGAVGYFLLCGQPPFAGRTLAELCGHHLHSAPVAPSLRLGTPVPEDLERVVLGCLAKDAAARPQTASALAEQLRGCLDAGSWSEEQAEHWWRAAPRPPEPSAALPPANRRAVDCADVKERVQCDFLAR